MKKLLFLVLFAAMAILCTSCYQTRTAVGDYQMIRKEAGKSATYTYAKGKQVWLFWGLIPLGRARVAVPPHGNCEIRTQVNFFDGILTTLTGGLFSMATIKVKARWEKPDTPSQETLSPAQTTVPKTE